MEQLVLHHHEGVSALFRVHGWGFWGEAGVDFMAGGSHDGTVVHCSKLIPIILFKSV